RKPDIDTSPSDIQYSRNIVIDNQRRDSETGAAQDVIKQNINGENQLVVQIPSNEIYEEERITISNSQKFIMKPLPSQNDPSSSSTFIQPLQEKQLNGVKTVPENSLLSVIGNGDVQIEGVTITHFIGPSEFPLIKTDDDGILRLIDIVLSPEQRVKSGDSIQIHKQGDNTKQQPFIYASGKLVILNGVTMEPTTFHSCSGIILNGTHGLSLHSFVTENTHFTGIDRKLGSGSSIIAIGFTLNIINTQFIGQIPSSTTSSTSKSSINSYKKNKINDEQCDWSTSSIKIEKSIAYFDSTTFTGLENGALSIGEGGKVTLTNSTVMYGNKPSGVSGRLQNIQRNIICDGTVSNKAQLRANSVSFLIDGSGTQSTNKWILSKKDTCELFWDLSNIANPLYTPIISEFKADVNQKEGGIQIQIKGTSLVGCGRIWIRISEINPSTSTPTSEKSPTTNDDLKKVIYPLEKIASQWDDDLSIIAVIPEDAQVVQKGKQIQIRIHTGESEQYSSVASKEGGAPLEALNVNYFIKDNSWMTPLIVVVAICGSLIIAILIFNCCFCYCQYSKKQAKQNQWNKLEDQ
ncbi:MAG: hypothetical protein EZS28_038228, partial [Streblomastix strix]